MKLNIILFLAIAVCSVIANCPPEDKLYTCKAKDEERQDLSCTCRELIERGKYNCTCFVDDQPTTPEVHYLDCRDAQKKGQNKNGVYSIKPDNMSSFKVYCDMETDGGGWTVFQRRQDGSVNFYRNWTDYEEGFGNLSGEFWLGLSKVHRLTSNGTNTLRVDLGDFENNTAYAQYSTFSVGDNTTEYTLNVGDYSGTAGDGLINDTNWPVAHNHNGMKFSTKDNENDNSGNCAEYWRGAWWFNACMQSHLNAPYHPNGGPVSSWSGVLWYDWKGKTYSLKFTEMKVRCN